MHACSPKNFLESTRSVLVVGSQVGGQLCRVETLQLERFAQGRQVVAHVQ